MKKSEIIYKRLREEYGDFPTWDDFAAEFGVSRQTIADRRSKEKVDYDEIVKVFPDVNKNWLMSEDEIELKSLPVKKSFTKEYENTTQERFSIDDSFHRLAGHVSEKGITRKDRDQLIAVLQDRANILSKDLQEFSRMISALRNFDNKDDS